MSFHGGGHSGVGCDSLLSGNRLRCHSSCDSMRSDSMCSGDRGLIYPFDEQESERSESRSRSLKPHRFHQIPCNFVYGFDGKIPCDFDSRIDRKIPSDSDSGFDVRIPSDSDSDPDPDGDSDFDVKIPSDSGFDLKISSDSDSGFDVKNLFDSDSGFDGKTPSDYGFDRKIPSERVINLREELSVPSFGELVRACEEQNKEKNVERPRKRCKLLGTGDATTDKREMMALRANDMCGLLVNKKKIAPIAAPAPLKLAEGSDQLSKLKDLMARWAKLDEDQSQLDRTRVQLFEEHTQILASWV